MENIKKEKNISTEQTDLGSEDNDVSLESFSFPSSIHNVLQLKIFPNFVKCENLGSYKDKKDAINEIWKTAEKIEKEIINKTFKDNISCIVKDYENNFFEISYNNKTQTIQIWVEKNEIK